MILRRRGPKVLMTATYLEFTEETLAGVLVTLKLWDKMSLEERRRFIKKGQVLDTPAGRELAVYIQQTEVSTR
jgi:hypothetical protein